MNADAPRTGTSANERGCYTLMYRINNTTVDPGDTLEIELYVSGYGRIDTSKLCFYPSTGLFDVKNSYVRFGVTRAADGAITFGGHEAQPGEAGSTLDLSGGIKIENWLRSTLYWDCAEGELPQIMTETKQRHAPVHMYLVTRRDIAPGSHFMQMTFTYFNGVEWSASSIHVEFVVRNFYQRNEGLVWVLGAVAAGASILSLILQILSMALQSK